MSDAPTNEPAPRRFGFGRVVLLIVGIMAVLVAAGLLAGGGWLLWLDRTQRDSSGYLSTGSEQVASTGYALASESFEIDSDFPDWFASDDVFGKVRIRAEATDGGDVFVGIGRTEDVERYLAGVAHDEISDFEVDPFRVDQHAVEGTGAPPSPPGEQSFWDASAEGSGEQTVLWRVESGDWSAVVMHADGSQGVDVNLSLGARVAVILWVAIGLLIAGVLALAAGILLIVLAFRHRGGAHAPAVPGPAAVATSGSPVGVAGRMDEDLSRWLWAFKWLLALPHYVILFFLWIAFFFATVIAFFGILFTGRYPRGIFDFNVGVIRWTWRVLFYSYWALGTDRYPPFTLDPAPDYPATLEIAYPEEPLSRGLVLVKWWLLAIPHYFVVSIFVGGGWWGWGWWHGHFWYAGGGLVTILVLIGGFALLFAGRYPLGLFNFALGLDRWVFRVIAYASLMTDRYPPFRLDQGPEEPAASSTGTT
jgi:Domain of unknown function (DUF4389)